MNSRNLRASLTALVVGFFIFPSTIFAQVETTVVNRTVGVVDPKAPMIFEDVTAKTALAKFKHVTATRK